MEEAYFLVIFYSEFSEYCTVCQQVNFINNINLMHNNEINYTPNEGENIFKGNDPHFEF